MTRADLDALPRLDRSPVPYHFRRRGGGVMTGPGVCYILNRTSTQVGVVIGGGEECNLGGCGGVKLSVRWPDGRLTRPCTKGLTDVPDMPDVMKIGG